MCLHYFRQASTHSQPLSMNRGFINQNSKHIDLILIYFPAPDVSNYLIDSLIDLCKTLICVDSDRVNTSDVRTNVLLVRLIVVIESRFETFVVLSN